MASKLDDFSWEILHSIFDYLNPFDLLNAFVPINAHFDSIFDAYQRIRIDCKQAKKSTFTSICERVHLHQIQSLRLSNDEPTPGQIQLFMSLVPLIQCSNLQYVTIEQINDANLLCLICSHLEDQPQIRSLSILNSPVKISRANARQIAHSLVTLSSLKYLTFPDSSTLTLLREPLLKLTHLTIELCHLRDLQMIFPQVPNLVYLRVFLPLDDLETHFDYMPPQLRSLSIESSAWKPFDAIENILALTPCLRHLTLDTFGDLALLDGQRWETLLRSRLPFLKELRLNIHPEENQITGDEVLRSFQSSFWLTKKRCHMACSILTTSRSCGRLFSVPDFAPTRDWYPSSGGFADYSVAPFPFHEHIEELGIAYVPEDSQLDSPWQSVQTLRIHFPIDDVQSLERIVNFSSIKHLILVSCLQGPVFSDVLQALPNLNQLTLIGKPTGHVLETLANIPCVYNHIKKLCVPNLVLSLEDIDIIAQIFPALEYIKLSIKNQADIAHVLEELRHLNSATVGWTTPWKISKEQMENYLQRNNISTDGAYIFDGNSLRVWIA